MTIDRVPFRTVAKFLSGGTPSKSRADYWEGTIPWVSPKDMGEPEISDAADHISDAAISGSATKLVGKGTILAVSRSGILARKWPVALVLNDVAFNQDIKAIVVDREKLEPEFAFWWLRSCEADVLHRGVKKGATVHSLLANFVEDQTIPLPSFEEQRRIVDVLNRAASIERLRRHAATHLRDFIPALFLKMFGDQDEIAARFDTTPLKELASLGSGVTKGRKLKDAVLVDVPYLRVANVQDGYLDLREIKTIPIRETEREKYALKAGDLVLTEGGDPDKLGRGALWQGELAYCAHQNHVFRVRPDTEQVLGEYLKEVVGSAYGKAYFLSVAKQTTGIASINKTQLGQFPVPIPPMELQIEFTKLVEAAQARARLIEKADTLASDLSTSLLDKLLGTDSSPQAEVVEQALAT